MREPFECVHVVDLFSETAWRTSDTFARQTSAVDTPRRDIFYSARCNVVELQTSLSRLRIE